MEIACLAQAGPGGGRHGGTGHSGTRSAPGCSAFTLGRRSSAALPAPGILVQKVLRGGQEPHHWRGGPSTDAVSHGAQATHRSPRSQTAAVALIPCPHQWRGWPGSLSAVLLLLVPYRRRSVVDDGTPLGTVRMVTSSSAGRARSNWSRCQRAQASLADQFHGPALTRAKLLLHEQFPPGCSDDRYGPWRCVPRHYTRATARC